MRNKLIVFFTLITTIGIACTNVSHAEDFNFTVPVQVNNLLPEVSAIGVKCGARSEALSPNIIGGDIGQSTLYSSSTTDTVPVPDSGNLSTTVNVKFNAKNGKDPNDAKKYVCYLWVIARTVSGSNVSTKVPSNNYLFSQPKPGTEFVGQVSGDIQ